MSNEQADLEALWGTLPAGSLLLEPKALAFKFARMAQREPVAKSAAMKGLLEELREARPLLLYGDAWIERINAVLGMPDDE